MFANVKDPRFSSLQLLARGHGRPLERSLEEDYVEIVLLNEGAVEQEKGVGVDVIAKEDEIQRVELRRHVEEAGDLRAVEAIAHPADNSEEQDELAHEELAFENSKVFVTSCCL